MPEVKPMLVLNPLEEFLIFISSVHYEVKEDSEQGLEELLIEPSIRDPANETYRRLLLSLQAGLHNDERLIDERMDSCDKAAKDLIWQWKILEESPFLQLVGSDSENLLKRLSRVYNHVWSM